MRNELAKTVKLDAVETISDVYEQDPLNIYAHRNQQNDEDSHATNPYRNLSAPIHGLETLPVLR